MASSKSQDTRLHPLSHHSSLISTDLFPHLFSSLFSFHCLSFLPFSYFSLIKLSLGLTRYVGMYQKVVQSIYQTHNKGVQLTIIKSRGKCCTISTCLLTLYCFSLSLSSLIVRLTPKIGYQFPMYSYFPCQWVNTKCTLLACKSSSQNLDGLNHHDWERFYQNPFLLGITFYNQSYLEALYFPIYTFLPLQDPLASNGLYIM